MQTRTNTKGENASKRGRREQWSCTIGGRLLGAFGSALVIFGCLAVLVGCPGAGPKPVTSPPKKAAGPKPVFSVAKLLPAEPTFFVIGKNVTALLEATRDGMEPLRVIDRDLTVDGADQALRKEVGFSFINIKDLDEAGLDIDGEVALFSTDIDPTIIVRVADRKAFDTYVAEKTKKLTKYVKRYRGQTVTSWMPDRQIRGSYVVVGDDLIVHFAFRKGRDWKPDLRWLDGYLERVNNESAASLAGSELMKWSLQQAGSTHRDVIALVDPLRLNEASLKVEPRRTSQKGCDALDRDLGELRRLVVSARLARRSTSFRAAALLGSAARAELAAASGSPSVGLPEELWRGPARFKINLRPDYLVKRIDRFGIRGCGLAYELLREFRRELRQLVQVDWFVRSEGRLALALLMADERGRNTLHLRGALVAAASAKGATEFFRSQVAIEAGKQTKIAGHEVELVRPMLTIADEVRLSVADGLLHLTAGEDVMKQVLTHTEAATGDAARTIFSARVAPGRIADIRAALKLLEMSRPTSSPTNPLRLVKYGRGGGKELDILGHFISSFKLLRADLKLSGDVLKTELQYELR